MPEGVIEVILIENTLVIQNDGVSRDRPTSPGSSARANELNRARGHVRAAQLSGQRGVGKLNTTSNRHHLLFGRSEGFC